MLLNIFEQPEQNLGIAQIYKKYYTVPIVTDTRYITGLYGYALTRQRSSNRNDKNVNA